MPTLPDLTVVIDEQPYLLTVGVVDKDQPVLLMAKDSDGSTALSGPVLTRAQAKAGVAHNSRPEKESMPGPFSNLDSSLYEGGT